METIAEKQISPKKTIVLISIIAVLLIGFRFYKKYKVTYYMDTNDFKNQSEYQLAKAVKWQNVRAITKLCKEHPEFVQRTYDDQYYSVLHWAVQIGKLKSAKALLDAGMNPNAQSRAYGTPIYALFENFAVYPPKQDKSLMTALLISYGADCNIPGDRGSPLIPAVRWGNIDFMSVKLLLEKGNADINYKSQEGHTALGEALDDAISFGDIKLVHYLVCEKHADVTIPCKIFLFSPLGKLTQSLSSPSIPDINNLDSEKDFTYPDEIEPVTLLRFLCYKLNSPAHKLKQEIIQEFKNQGVDYYAEPVPPEIEILIRQEYPDSWEEYLKEY
ncbi:ankyrin repeat domain-containing protein [Treponema sp.]|uniref:ankyrin repeat domain-containing protein n=1 Tax=Treponema sp. TaxID=166 RepID=UPI00298EA45E|nr:ankyrin repeat domain-containing protein [Treponema sp.]MCR5612570.1 ankyrin repeat domain-containing protein [Treponema sp.]